MTYSETWNLSSVFEGGADSPAFHEKLGLIKEQIADFEKLVADWQPQSGQADAERFERILDESKTILNGLSQVGTFTNAHSSADVTDTVPVKNMNKISLLVNDYQTIFKQVSKKIEAIPDEDWQKVIAQEPFKTVAFRLNEIRRDAGKLLSTEKESIISQLSIDGHEGWGSMYDDLVATIQVPIEEDGSVNYYSAGQAHNKLTGEEDVVKRQTILQAWEDAWQSKAKLFATTLNHIIGFRLTDQKLHDEKDYMNPPLEYNRLSKETLNTMWDTINKNKGRVVEFMSRKAKLMGLEKLSWADVEAPLSIGNFKTKYYTFNEAADFIMENFQQVSPQMKNLAQKAFEEGWIEAEDRPNKRPGGYCASLPESEESRIFMTYSGTPDNVATLAHELGHAFHSYVLKDQAKLNQQYAMNVAETASTFAEMVVSDATIKNASSDEEKISLLDNKISRAAIMFMDIHSRFIFEKNFYAERQEGLVSAERMNEIMLAAQKEAFNDSLSTYHPNFWASKLHFYMTGLSFYNFPYTFGFLFSMGIYSRALESGDQFEDNYIKLLQDTASMTTEDLAEKHLGVDLKRADFWQSAIDLILEDIDQYMKLTEQYV